MAQLFSQLLQQPQQKQPTPEELMKANKKSVVKSRRQMDREVRALERQEQKVATEVKKLMQQGRASDARKMAQEIVRIRKSKEHMLKTKTVLGTVQNKTETAKSNMAMTTALSRATRAMATANSVNGPEKIQKTMNEFEKQQQLMELQEEMLDELLEDNSDEEEVDEVIDEVFDAIGIELNAKMVSAPKTMANGSKNKNQEKADDDKDVAELKALLQSL